MKRKLVYNDCLKYPGDYIPMHNEEEIREELQDHHEGNLQQPLVNIKEVDNLYKVEIAIPGVKREDFVIYAEENILTVSLLHKESDCGETEKFKMHEYNFGCFKRLIMLPEDAETELACAEYKGGILRLYIPKINQVVKNLHTTIVVY